MAYGDDIDNLSADHRWAFDNDYLDSVGSANGTGTGTAFTANPICLDATYAMEINAATNDRVSIPTTTDINNSVQAIKAVGGWFWTSASQQPFVRIYGEGNATICFHLVMGLGNNLCAEVRDASQRVQVYNVNPIAFSRPYHLLMRYSDNANNNLFDFFIDGVKMLLADPSDRQPDDAGLTARGVGEFGDPVGTVGLDGVTFLIVGPGQTGTSRYNQWATWDGTELTDTEIREELFERGALADVTISTGTESAMQTALDVYADTDRDDAPCCIEVAAVSGGGDFTLDLDNITFDALASIHVRYNGAADTLTLRNTNGADCSITSAPFGGTIALRTETTVKVTVQDAQTFADIQSARVLLLAATGGDLPYQDSMTITRVTTTATVTHTAHGLVTGNKVYIAGANQQEYNGVKTITVTSANAYTYTVSGSPTTPATGTITSTAVILDDATDVNGEATITFDYSSDQPVSGKVRKGTATPYYQEAALTGTITIDGYDAVAFQVADE